MNMLHVHTAFHGICSCCMMLLVHAVCPTACLHATYSCCMFMLHVHDAWSCCSVHDACPCCLSMLHAHVSMLHIHALCRCCMSMYPCRMSMLHIHPACPCLHAAFLCCLSMLHVHTAYCACWAATLRQLMARISLSMASPPTCWRWRPSRRGWATSRSTPPCLGPETRQW